MYLSIASCLQIIIEIFHAPKILYTYFNIVSFFFLFAGKLLFRCDAKAQFTQWLIDLVMGKNVARASVEHIAFIYLQFYIPFK